MDKFKFAAILAAGAALTLSPAHVAAQTAQQVDMAFGLQPHPEGAQVTWVAPGGTAAAMGLNVGDIVVEVGGKPISPEMFQAFLQNKKVGDQLSFKVKREGVFVELTGKALPLPPPPPPPPPGSFDMGWSFQNRPEGAMIGGMHIAGTAAVMGIKLGDIIVELDGKPFSAQVAQEHKQRTKLGDRVSVKVRRATATRELTGKALVNPLAAPAPAAPPHR